MNLASAKAGDLILADKKGRRFHAEIVEKLPGMIRVLPLDSRISYRQVSAREVIGLWHKSRQGSRSKAQELAESAIEVTHDT